MDVAPLLELDGRRGHGPIQELDGKRGLDPFLDPKRRRWL